jgi:hypothetical protein
LYWRKIRGFNFEFFVCFIIPYTRDAAVESLSGTVIVLHRAGQPSLTKPLRERPKCLIFTQTPGCAKPSAMLIVCLAHSVQGVCPEPELHLRRGSPLFSDARIRRTKPLRRSIVTRCEGCVQRFSSVYPHDLLRHQNSGREDRFQDTNVYINCFSCNLI